MQSTLDSEKLETLLPITWSGKGRFPSQVPPTRLGFCDVEFPVHYASPQKKAEQPTIPLLV